MCCSFYLKLLDEVLKSGNYRDYISIRQSSDASNGFSQSDTVLDDTKLYKASNEPVPEAGRDKGLTLIVDGTQTNYQDQRYLKILEDLSLWLMEQINFQWFLIVTL